MSAKQAPIFNEMMNGADVRAAYQNLEQWYRSMPAELRSLKQSEAEDLFRRVGITFAVYGEGGDPERLIPFDMFPRVLTASEWRKLDRGIRQRAAALNAFLCDVYGRRERNAPWTEHSRYTPPVFFGTSE